MAMETTTKARTPSRCREWERQRRNKFNEAISKLGEVVKAINKANEASDHEADIQYPKIEIIQKAIICLTNCDQEKTQLKAEILALQVKLDDCINKKLNFKDASTQVFVGINKKNQSSKYMKLMMLQKSKRNALKEKSTLTTNVTVKSSSENTHKKLVSKPVTPAIISHNTPKLLPKLNIDKKGPENTIVVLPATPYIFPQRPLIFPTVPPAFVIVDNLQSLNKPSAPVVNRNNGDITKTTMVNILPISAYSRPLSAIDITKNKKNNVKSKSDVCKKSHKKKSTSNIEKEIAVQNTSKSHKSATDSKATNKKNTEKYQESKKVSEETSSKTITQPTTNQELSIPVSKDNEDNSKMKSKESDFPSKIVEPTKTNSESVIMTKLPAILEKNTSEIQNTVENNKFTKVASEIETLTEDKDKENKLPNILDTTLCDNVVDTGNSRLELAEEFLAASPTAAFLMSFPLVSGNRADSPAEEPQSTVQTSIKDNSQRRNDATTQPVTFYEKMNATDIKMKSTNKTQAPSNILNKHNEQQKYTNTTDSGDNVNSKEVNVTCKTTTTAVLNVTHENPFLNLPMSTLISTNCTLSDSTFGLDFDCNISKSISNQPTSYVSTNNFFYKGDPFNTVKSTIYSTSNISSGHEFNSLGLYPCAMEKYTSKNKTDYTNVEDNLMKIGSSRLTYDIDLGWSHKGFDFVNCTTSTNTFSKDILTTVSAPYSNSYNPFNPEFQFPLVTSSNKKDASKPNSTFTDTITSFYSQPTNLWTDDVPFYTNNNHVPKTLNAKHQNYLPSENMQTNISLKPSNKHYETKQISETVVENGTKCLTLPHQASEKYTKKSPSKMHINWMTSETRPMTNHCIPNHMDVKENHKVSYGQLDPSQITKKQEHNDTNYFPISMHNFPMQSGLEELQVWPSTRPVGPTEISIEPPPINLPTLVGDLALGPHDKKKNSELGNRGIPQTDIQNCSNFLSVTQLMNRSSDSIPSRYQAPNIDLSKSIASKQSITHFTNETNRKAMSTRIESQTQPCYTFNDSKTMNSYENVVQFSHNKPKTNKTDKTSKSQKNSYSAEALIRGGSCTQKTQDSSAVKFMMPSQKYNNFNGPQENSIAQVSHFPPILDYTDNSYASQQLSGTTLYNSTTNTISNSFYSNFMPGSSNLMSGNYTSGPFHGEFIDYNQTPECSYTNHKYEELKMRNNPAVFQQQDKVPSNYKSSRRESAAKHKLECSKKESSKKYQSKRSKLNNDVDEWNDPSHSLWQNKPPSKRHSNLMTDELGFPNYVSNQVPTQYQSDFFNSHLMSSSMPSVGHNIERSLTSLPVTSRANFNLSSIFPEITMKVQ